jgi:hypothetical protein
MKPGGGNLALDETETRGLEKLCPESLVGVLRAIQTIAASGAFKVGSV